MHQVTFCRASVKNIVEEELTGDSKMRREGLCGDNPRRRRSVFTYFAAVARLLHIYIRLCSKHGTACVRTAKSVKMLVENMRLLSNKPQLHTTVCIYQLELEGVARTLYCRHVFISAWRLHIRIVRTYRTSS